MAYVRPFVMQISVQLVRDCAELARTASINVKGTRVNVSLVSLVMDKRVVMLTSVFLAPCVKKTPIVSMNATVIDVNVTRDSR